IQAAGLVLREQPDQQLLDRQARQRRTRIVRLRRRDLDAEAVADLAARALEILEAHEGFAKQLTRQMQQPCLGIRRQAFDVNARAAAERLQTGMYVVERRTVCRGLRITPGSLGKARDAPSERLLVRVR